MTGQAAELRKVSGPSALGGGWSRFWDLLWLISVTEFKRTYFGTVLGYVWSLVRPLLLFAVLLFVFTKIIRLGSDVPNYAVLLLLNIVVFSFFSEATANAVTSVVAQEGVVRKTQFPRLVIPLAVILTALFNLAVNLVVVWVFIAAYGVDPTWTWLLFPIPLTLVFVFATGVSLLLSALYVRFRDVAIIWTVVAQVLLYATPVIYPFDIVPEQYRDAMLLNPLVPIFEQMRHWIIDPSAPSAVELAGGYLQLVPAALVFVAVCALGAWTFRRSAPVIAEEL